MSDSLALEVQAPPELIAFSNIVPLFTGCSNANKIWHLKLREEQSKDVRIAKNRVNGITA